MLQIETTETHKQDSEPSQTPKRKVIKITGSINPMLWYSKYIGQEFEVLRFEMSKRMGLTAWVLEPHPYLRFINWLLAVITRLLWMMVRLLVQTRKSKK